jgi:hypothetical protein
MPRVRCPSTALCERGSCEIRWRSRKRKIEVEGEVVEALPSTMFKVQIDGGHAVLAPIKVEVPPTT